MLQLKHIHKHYGSKTVADNITLNVSDGHILAILGRSGSVSYTHLTLPTSDLV